MRMIIKEVIAHDVVVVHSKDDENGRTRSRAISKSNIRNKIATKKNRKEKGRRGELIGSKPHS